MNKRYKELLNESVGEQNVRNLRIAASPYDDNTFNIIFETTTEDTKEKTCVLLINTRESSVSDVVEFMEYEFIPEFSRLTVDGTLESELDEVDDFDLCDCDSEIDCECQDDDYEEDTESIDSVAAGLGFYIDDDDHWIPRDNVYSDCWFDDDEDLEPLEEYRELADGSIEFIDNYRTFMFVYKDEEEAKKYKE